MKTHALLFSCLVASVIFTNRLDAQINVVQPGDPVVLVNGVNDGDGNFGPPPTAEGVEHAIDGLLQKYLNFLDLGSGFIVTPSRGVTIVTALRFYTANDAEERDPASYTLEGSTSGPGGPWTTISSGALSLPFDRNGGGAIPINSATHFNQLVTFPNSAAFNSYRVTFPTLKNAAAANSMQIAEVELLGMGALETAGDLFVSVDGTSAPEGTLNSIANSGTLGGVFEARGGGITVPTIAFAGGTKGIQFDGFDYMQLVAGPGGAIIAPPAGLVGIDPTRTIEVWALNPYVANEETLVSWGKRNGPDGSNMSFHYASNGGYGAVGHWGAPDIGWNNAGGAPASKRWHHLVYTYDGTTTRVYSDGALANSEVLGPGAINTHAGTAINLATQLEADGVTPTPVLRGSLTIGRVRIHDGVLSDAQVQNNYNLERSVFIDPVPPVPQLLASAPVHRYSFNNAPAADGAGATLVDSIGTANGTVLGAGTAFTGTRLTLAGGPSATAGYADLPNGLLSANGTNNGGSGRISIEGWVKVTGNHSWARLFDFGSSDVGGGVGGELLGPGGGGEGRDYFMYSAQNGGDVNFHRLELRNEDPSGGGIVTFDVPTATFNTDLHFVVTWQESTGELKIYENGNEVGQIFTDDRISDIHDVNVWLGRSNWVQDENMQGEFDEFRIYDSVLTPGEVLGNFQRGPDNVGVAIPPYAAAVLADGPIAYWRFNNDVTPGATNSGTLGAAANGTYNGDAFPGSQAPRPPAFAGFENNNTALQLDGTGDFVGTVAGFLNGKTNVTVSGWIRRNGPQNNRTGLFGQNDLIEFGYINNSTLQLWVDNFAGPVDVPNPFPDLGWVHVAFTLNGTQMKVYTNGFLAGTTALPSSNYGTTSYPFNIGGGGVFDDGAANGNFFNGQIDEVAVFDRELTAQQIANHFAATAPVLTASPSASAACIGGIGSFTVLWQGPGSVQWQKRPPGGTFANIPGATSATYFTPPVTAADDGTAYRALITGGGITVVSGEAELHVLNVPLPIVTYDFNSGLPAGTAIFGSSAIDGANGWLELNPNIGSQNGAFVTMNMALGSLVNGFSASFKVRMIPGSSPPADGFSFNWATDLPLGILPAAEEGHTSGLSVCFDTYDNTFPNSEAPAIDVKWNGSLVAHTMLPLGFLVTGNFEDVQIRLNPNGTLDLLYRCSAIFAGLPIPGFTPLSGARFGFASRTGGLQETHTIDDLALQLSFDPASAPRITSTERQAPNALIINGTGIPGAALALQASTDLVNWSWRANLATDLSGIFQFIEPDITTPPSRFYRLLSVPQLPAGLVTWWRAENNHLDSFGPNHGSAFGTAPSFAAGQRGQAFSFNGTTDGMLIGAAPVPLPWTACFWVNRQDAAEPSAALLTDPSFGLKLEQWELTRRVGFTAFGVADYYSSYSVPVNVWTHLAFVGSPGGTIIYANGTAVETNAAIIPLPMNILGVRENSFDHMQGQLDETTIFNRALSPAEIQRVINATRGP